MKRILLTGGTGFVGRSIIDRFPRVADADAELTILTRSTGAFVARFPELSSLAWIKFVQGDVRDAIDNIGVFDGIIHAASSSDAAEIGADPQAAIDTIIVGTRNILKFAERLDGVPVLFTSSGAVYGIQPPTMERLSESYVGQVDSLQARNAYAEAKRLAEVQCMIASELHKTNVKIARLFTFVGRHLPLRKHFAIGNFIADVIENRPKIVVNGDGRAIRSYLFADDMVDWLFKILEHGETATAYNVGAEESIEIIELARLVAAHSGRSIPVEVRGAKGEGLLSNRYVPDTARARQLGLRATVLIGEAVDRTIRALKGGLLRT